jgi:hypothetical protein
MVNEPYTVSLRADKISAEVGEVIRFTASSNADRQDVFYEFNFGATHLRPQREGSVEYSFNELGEFIASVNLVARSGEVLAESSLLIKIIPPVEEARDNWIIYLTILVVLILLGYSTYKWFIAPKVTLNPKKDSGKQAIKDLGDIIIDFEIKLSGNLSNAKYETKLTEKSLISSFRRLQ